MCQVGLGARLFEPSETYVGGQRNALSTDLQGAQSPALSLFIPKPLVVEHESSAPVRAICKEIPRIKKLKAAKQLDHYILFAHRKRPANPPLSQTG